ncbi:MAG: cyclic-di-AMP receptor [Chloroflexi bacterium]|nr:cyclic-di-AMP receptor [Chloroflexota bacterium]MCL5274915.1 cyclic-di-AMP receptor [Chloroflexota bacterium]
MKMVMAVVQADDAPKVMEALVQAGHRVTRLATTGGWLRRENVTLLLGLEDDKVDDALQILQQKGQRRSAYRSMPVDITGSVDAEVFEVEVGGATVFVLNVDEFAHY